MTELKPCPFCGQKVTMIRNDAEGCFCIYHAEALPTRCAIEEPFVIITDDEEYARKAWNRRANDAEIH